MHYQIIPLEMGSLVQRYVFQKNNQEIKCGTVWKLGSLITIIKPKFIKHYQAQVGICISDIPGAEISKTYDGEKVIYFSETVDDDEQDELTDIFYGKSKKYSGEYCNIFQDLGWKYLGNNAYIFGELEIKEVSHEPLKYK